MDLYGISIALTIRSLDPSLFVRLIPAYREGERYNEMLYAPLFKRNGIKWSQREIADF